MCDCVSQNMHIHVQFTAYKSDKFHTIVVHVHVCACVCVHVQCVHVRTYEGVPNSCFVFPLQNQNIYTLPKSQ